MIKLHFANMGELLDYVKPTTEKHWSHRIEAPRPRAKPWCGTLTWEDAVELAEHGWPEGLRKLAVTTESIKQSTLRVSDDLHWDVTGQLFDVGMVMAGEPECWLENSLVEEKRVVRVVASVAMSKAVRSQQIINRGAAICALIDALQSRGHIVEAQAAFFSDYSGGMEVRQDIGSTPLDMDQVAFVLAHPAYLRRLIFACMEVAFQRENCGSYGHPDNTDDQHDTETIYLPCGYTNRGLAQFDTLESSTDWVNMMLRKIG